MMPVSSLRPTDKLLLPLITLLAIATLLTWWRSPMSRDTLVPRPLHFQIDLNTADAATLQLLPGIGPATARKILNDRRQRGPFRSVDALQRIPGIGAKTVKALRPWVTLNTQPPQSNKSP